MLTSEDFIYLPPDIWLLGEKKMILKLKNSCLQQFTGKAPTEVAWFANATSAALRLVKPGSTLPPPLFH